MGCWPLMEPDPPWGFCGTRQPVLLQLAVWRGATQRGDATKGGIKFRFHSRHHIMNTSSDSDLTVTFNHYFFSGLSRNAKLHDELHSSVNLDLAVRGRSFKPPRLLARKVNEEKGFSSIAGWWVTFHCSLDCKSLGSNSVDAKFSEFSLSLSR